jgi:uncharacterized membrane protein YqgA involved in biofilm formation
MLAVFVNMACVFIGSLLGIFFRSRLRESIQRSLIIALGLCTVVIGASSAVATNDVLCIIICMAVGTALGELLSIDDAIENAGEFFRRKFVRDGGAQSRFTEGFVSACILFCVGSMTIVGSLEAGIHHDYSIIFAKSTLDFVSSMALGAAMGYGVTCSVLFILVMQGGLTLLAGAVSPVLSDAVVNEMSAIGGTILIGMAVNMLELGKERIKIANMLPAVFLPIAYIPVSKLLSSLF